MSIEALDLADYRRKVQATYFGVRDTRISVDQRWNYWVAARNELIGKHAQSPLSREQRERFEKLPYYPYDPALRFLVDVDTEVEPQVFEIPLQTDGSFQMQRLGKVHFGVAGNQVALSLFRLLGYGGGLFLPFRDASDKSGKTYPGTRYLLDTIKGADLGMEQGKLVVDFNFAYNPSCAYHPRWNCPLAPAENWLKVEIAAGEQAYPDAAKSN